MSGTIRNGVVSFLLSIAAFAPSLTACTIPCDPGYYREGNWCIPYGEDAGADADTTSDAATVTDTATITDTAPPRDASADGCNLLWFRDEDGDGYGTPDSSELAYVCPGTPGYAERAGDCNDREPRVHADAPEVCDHMDNDCDGTVDEEVRRITCYRDADGDGIASTATASMVCAAEGGGCPTGYAATSPQTLDCDDADPRTYPGASETCDGRDNACRASPTPDASFVCRQGATVACTTTCGSAGTQTCTSMCTRPASCQPPVEICNFRDDDCDGDIDERVTRPVLATWPTRVSDSSATGVRIAVQNNTLMGSHAPSFAAAWGDGPNQIVIARLNPDGTLGTMVRQSAPGYVDFDLTFSHHANPVLVWSTSTALYAAGVLLWSDSGLGGPAIVPPATVLWTGAPARVSATGFGGSPTIRVLHTSGYYLRSVSFGYDGLSPAFSRAYSGPIISRGATDYKITPGIGNGSYVAYSADMGRLVRLDEDGSVTRTYSSLTIPAGADVAVAAQRDYTAPYDVGLVAVAWSDSIQAHVHVVSPDLGTTRGRQDFEFQRPPSGTAFRHLQLASAPTNKVWLFVWRTTMGVTWQNLELLLNGSGVPRYTSTLMEQCIVADPLIGCITYAPESIRHLDTSVAVAVGANGQGVVASSGSVGVWTSPRVCPGP